MAAQHLVRSAAAFGLCLGLIATVAPSPVESQPAPKLDAPAVAGPAAGAPKVDPQAVKALRDMSAYLQSFSSFELNTQTSLDVVTNDGQKIQLDGTARYRVRKPNAFVIDIVSDTWNRQLVYDGKEFTLYAPKRGYFATVPAPATIKDTIAEIETRFGISVPLDDLFRWSDDGTRAESLQSGFLVGAETVDGAKTNHYAFRDGEIDWQIWIQQGDRPLPRKLVIVDRRDAALPGYSARLTWTLNPSLSDQDFAFRPGPDAKRIRLVLQQ